MKRLPWIALVFALGVLVGCTTAAVIAQDDATPNEVPAPTATDPKPADLIVGPSQATVRYAPNGKAKALLYATGKNAFLGRLEMDAGAKVPEHRDPTEEYIYVLQGSGTISIDDQSYQIGPETLVYMPAGAKVSYTNGPQPLIALQVFAGPGPEKKYDAWSATEIPPASPE